MQSQPNSLNKEDVRDWIHNLIVFLMPLGLLYVTTVITTIQAHAGVLSLKDFQVTVGLSYAMALYVLNALLDIFRKFKSS